MDLVGGVRRGAEGMGTVPWRRRRGIQRRGEPSSLVGRHGRIVRTLERHRRVVRGMHPLDDVTSLSIHPSIFLCYFLFLPHSFFRTSVCRLVVIGGLQVRTVRLTSHRANGTATRSKLRFWLWLIAHNDSDEHVRSRSSSSQRFHGCF